MFTIYLYILLTQSKRHFLKVGIFTAWMDGLLIFYTYELFEEMDKYDQNYRYFRVTLHCGYVSKKNKIKEEQIAHRFIMVHSWYGLQEKNYTTYFL